MLAQVIICSDIYLNELTLVLKYTAVLHFGSDKGQIKTGKYQQSLAKLGLLG